MKSFLVTVAVQEGRNQKISNVIVEGHPLRWFVGKLDAAAKEKTPAPVLIGFVDAAAGSGPYAADHSRALKAHIPVEVAKAGPPPKIPGEALPPATYAIAKQGAGFIGVRTRGDDVHFLGAATSAWVRQKEMAARAPFPTEAEAAEAISLRSPQPDSDLGEAVPVEVAAESAAASEPTEEELL